MVVSIETIEHLENPRALFRELVRALRPGGLLLVTTPNQLSVLSKLCFVLKDRHRSVPERALPRAHHRAAAHPT